MFRHIHWSLLFWILFIVAGISVIVTAVTNLFSLTTMNIIVGLVVIVVGSGKLAEELSSRRVLGYQSDVYRKLGDISEQLEHTFNFASDHRQKTEYRIYQLERKRLDHEMKLEERYQELMKKVIEMENRFSKVMRQTLELEAAIKSRKIQRADFAQKVLTLVKKIPRGKVTTHKEIAKFLGKPNMVMIVGKVLKKNAYIKTIPTHRVVKSTGHIAWGDQKAAKEMRDMLLKEKIKIEKDRVDLDKHMFRFSEMF